MVEQNISFFQKFSQNSRKLLKIHKILPFFDKINPYKENRVSEADGRILEKQWVVYYREFVPWLIDTHIDGLAITFVLAVFGVHPFSYWYIAAEGIALWFVAETLTLFWNKIIDGMQKIVRELPRK